MRRTRISTHRLYLDISAGYKNLCDDDNTHEDDNDITIDEFYFYINTHFLYH